MLCFSGIKHQFQSRGKSQCSEPGPPEHAHPFPRAPARIPIAPSLLILLPKNKPFPKFLRNIIPSHLNHTDIYKPERLAAANGRGATFIIFFPTILIPHFSHCKEASFLTLKIAVFIYIYIHIKQQTTGKQQTDNQHYLRCATHRPLQRDDCTKQALQTEVNFSHRKSDFTRHATV